MTTKRAIAFFTKHKNMLLIRHHNMNTPNMKYISALVSCCTDSVLTNLFDLNLNMFKTEATKIVLFLSCNVTMYFKDSDSQ